MFETIKALFKSKPDMCIGSSDGYACPNVVTRGAVCQWHFDHASNIEPPEGWIKEIKL